MAAQPWQNGKVIRIEDETASTKRFWIELTETTRFDFISGQFVTLELPIHEQQSKRARSYSIASAPNGTNVFELVIVLMEGGLGTSYLFTHAVVGTEFQSMFSIVGLDVGWMVKLTLSWFVSHKWSPCIVWFPDGRRRS
jgi:CDP-4-dehydro-6-deoxyglucose reductase